jgi:hypothetical protein
MLSIKAKSGKPLSEDEMIQCLVIESMHSHIIVEHVMQTKRKHCNTILQKQACQKHCKSYNQAAVARLSHMSSEESMVRSHKIAVRLMELDA